MQPVFLIGALRSGTKILRDTIGLHPEISFLRYEPEFIWRTGCEGRNFDNLSANDVTDYLRTTTRKKIYSYARKSPIFLEKSVANCFRLEFIDDIFPEAKYIYLMRNGWDNVESIHRQWNTTPSFQFMLSKLLDFPWWSDFSALKYMAHYAQRTFQQKFLKTQIEDVKTWGVRYKGIDDDLINQSLIEVCAKQWASSVLSSYEILNKMPSGKVLCLRYEDFVNEPLRILQLVSNFLNVEYTRYLSFDKEISKISPKSVGFGKNNLNIEDQKLILEIIREPLTVLGYS